MPTKKASPCFDCRELDKQEHVALKELAKGTANEYQQRLCLKIIVNDFARTHDLCYIPDSFDQSTFIAGRAFVGQKILKYLNIPVGKITHEEEQNETP